jgi:D-serine deaminase-like pyridoxal phosphate-dependent protein
MTTTLLDLPTPAALLERPRLEANIARMQRRIAGLGVALRPHVKTAKCLEVATLQRAAGARGIAVSTLKEAETFFKAGFDDIVYAVALPPNKVPAAIALQRAGCDLKVIVDSLPAAQALVALAQLERVAMKVLIEIDSDGHRAGVKPDSDELVAIGRALHEGGMALAGVMTHAGASYDCTSATALVAMAEQERSRTVRAAERLRAAGLPCPVVSVGSTPTALTAEHLDGVTEVRAGVYAFFDLVMAGVGGEGVCRLDEIALSVLTTVIGHQADRGWILVDAGWMAMSRDRGTAVQAVDWGYGAVCARDGTPLAGLVLHGANQEHGIVQVDGGAGDATLAERFPVGSLLRILPNHACATAAQHEAYQVVDGERVTARWARFGGW